MAASCSRLVMAAADAPTALPIETVATSRTASMKKGACVMVLNFLKLKRHLAHIAPLCAHAKIDSTNYAIAIVLGEIRCRNAILQFLFTN